MRKMFFVLLTALLCALTACGGNQVATKGVTGGTTTVSQIMENAAKDEPSPPPSGNVIEPSPPAEMEPVVQQPAPEHTPTAEGVDVDLTQMSATMVYAEVSNMMYCPDDYVGKIVRMRGQNINSYYDVTDQTYHSVLIADATACCAQGLEYVLSDENAAYPESDAEITVTGEFELYEELGALYCRLKDAKIEA